MKKLNIKYRTIVYVLIMFSVVFCIIQFQFLKEVAEIVFISFIIAYTLMPIHKKMIEKGLENKFSALCIILLFIAIFSLFLVILIPMITRESVNINDIIEQIGKYFSRLCNSKKYLRTNKIVGVITDKLYLHGNIIFKKLMESIVDNVIKFGESFLSFLVVPIFVYYFLVDREMISNRFMMYFPREKRGIIKKILKDIDKILSRYIISQFLLCTLIGIFTYFVLLIAGVKFAVILSIINGFFNIIPYFGPIIGCIPAILIGFTKSIKTGVITFLGLYIIQQIEGNIISPKIVGETVSIHPFIVILLLIIGEKVGGFLGMVLAIPIGVTVKIIYEDINYYLF